MKITVLMSTYNGEKYLRQQLDSLLNQQLMPTTILIRDDGSNDETINILEEYSSNYSFIKYYYGDNKKPAKSFFDLINKCEEADYYALCDQDDFWFEDKLSSAVEVLNKEDNSKPLLYMSRFTLTDEKLNPINSDISRLYSYTDYAHSLIYQTAPGCTFVFNNEAIKKIRQYDIEKNYCIIHDSIIHKVVAMFGKVILDKESHMYYRQHGNNEIGLTADKAKTFIGRIEHFISGKVRNTRSEIAKSLLDVYGKELSEDKKKLLVTVAKYKENSEYRKHLLCDDCFKTGTINDLFFKILVLVNYI